MFTLPSNLNLAVIEFSGSVTETQGRIHTSACTVAVLAEVENISEINVKPEEIRVDVFRASGAGGQHVNKTSQLSELLIYRQG